MIKKIFSIVLSFFILGSLVSCNTNDKITLKRDPTIESAIDLYESLEGKDNLKELKENKESFLLYGYIYTCPTCRLFSKMYDEYVKNRKVILYKATLQTVTSLETKDIDEAPFLAIYKEGKIKKIFYYSKNEKIFKDPNEFNKFIDKYFIMEGQSMLNLTKEQLDLKLKNNDEFIVYFGWNECPDCIFMDKEYLNKFIKNNDKVFYYYETAYLHSEEDDPILEEKWKNFKIEYGFASYREGRVPSICYYKDGKIQDFAVYLNDELEFDEENNKVKIISSYYKDNPYINHEYKGKSILDAYENYKNSLKDFYNQKMDEFFNQYLK